MSQTFLFYVLYNLREKFNQMAQGAAQQNISKERVAQTHVPVPPRSLVGRFDDMASATWLLLKNLQKRNLLLRQTSDLLLPKLISGEVNVAAASSSDVEDLAPVVVK